MEHSKLHSKGRRHKSITPVKAHWEMNRTSSKYETGTIYSLSIQGYSVYVVVRKLGKKVKDADGNYCYLGQGLYGNRYNVPEDKLTMSEVLLPTNLDTRCTFMNFDSLIGQTVKVELYDDIPRMVYIEPSGVNQARVAPRDIVSRARSTNDEMLLCHAAAYEMLDKFGVSKNLVDLINQDLLTQGVVTYGKVASADKISQDDVSSGADLSKSAAMNIVTGLPEAELKEKPCHKHPVILGGL